MTESAPPRTEGPTGPQAARQVYRAGRNPSAKEQREYLRRHREQLAADRRRRLKHTPSRLLATRGARRRLAVGGRGGILRAGRGLHRSAAPPTLDLD